MKQICLILAAFILVALSACGPKSAEYGVKGAAGGAVAGSFVGAMTDLIVDGKVDTYRLTRNAVGGAVAGGTAGAIAGHQQDKADVKQSQAAEQAVTTGASATAGERQALREQIGAENVQALQALVQCRHEDAYRIGLGTAKSANPDHREAGLVVQALVDRDRDNREGANRVLPEIVTMNDKISDLAAAQKGLEDLHLILLDERKVQGLSPTCK